MELVSDCQQRGTESRLTDIKQGVMFGRAQRPLCVIVWPWATHCAAHTPENQWKHNISCFVHTACKQLRSPLLFVMSNLALRVSVFSVLPELGCFMTSPYVPVSSSHPVKAADAASLFSDRTFADVMRSQPIATESDWGGPTALWLWEWRAEMRVIAPVQLSQSQPFVLLVAER